jgi:hypothetical protein
MGMHYHKLGYPAYGTAFPHTGAHQHMKMHFHVLGYPSIWECTLSPMGDPRSMYTPQWGLPIGEYMLPILPNGDYQLGRINSPMGSFRGGMHILPNGESPMGSVRTPNEDSPMWSTYPPQWRPRVAEYIFPMRVHIGVCILPNKDSPLGSIYSPIATSQRGLYTPQCVLPMGEYVHSPTGIPQWGVYTLRNEESPLGSRYSPMETPHSEVCTPHSPLRSITPQWGLPIGEYILPIGSQMHRCMKGTSPHQELIQMAHTLFFLPPPGGVLKHWCCVAVRVLVLFQDAAKFVKN